ncbi:hypothetical protein [Saccharothrix xinjiangensis]|uniref:Uncharacterized protein n=1 Tax=Saccharothrix xinjiangensis TaxID=204798 RepID=A0ABV9XTQ0_9PSEU
MRGRLSWPALAAGAAVVAVGVGAVFATYYVWPALQEAVPPPAATFVGLVLGFPIGLAGSAVAERVDRRRGRRR